MSRSSQMEFHAEFSFYDYSEVSTDEISGDDILDPEVEHEMREMEIEFEERLGIHHFDHQQLMDYDLEDIPL